MMRPAIAATRRPGVENFYFLADYHALIKCQEPERVHRSTLEIAASWLAAGLDPQQVTFYRQSDIPEIPELHWLLTCDIGFPAHQQSPRTPIQPANGKTSPTPNGTICIG